MILIVGLIIQSMSVQDGAVFVLNPELNIIEGNEEYIIGQITVQTQSDFVAIF